MGTTAVMVVVALSKSTYLIGGLVGQVWVGRCIIFKNSAILVTEAIHVCTVKDI